jgi:hypothetical protein
MRKAEDERRRVDVGEVDQVRTRRRVIKVEREQVCRGERAPTVGVGEDGAALTWLVC